MHIHHKNWRVKAGLSGRKDIYKNFLRFDDTGNRPEKEESISQVIHTAQ
jgi:hypothetical protein